MRVTMMKLFNLLLSPIGRVASRPMRNIETFPSKQMYLYLSLVERKVAEFYHNTWLKWLVFIAFSGQLMVSLPNPREIQNPWMPPPPLLNVFEKTYFYSKNDSPDWQEYAPAWIIVVFEIASYFGPSLKVSISSLRLLRQQLLIVSNWQAPFPLSLTKF